MDQAALATDSSESKLTRQRIDAALELRRKHTTSTQSLHKQYAGKSYRGWGNDNLENHAFKWVTTVVPQLVFNNPGVRVSDMGIEDEETQALQLAIRALLPQINFAQVLTRVAYDVQFEFGVTMSRLEPTPGLMVQTMMQPMRPSVLRVSPRMYFRDPDAPLFDGIPRYEGHMWVRRRSDLAKQMSPDGVTPMYDPAKLAALDSDPLPSQVRMDLMIDGIAIPDDDKELVVGYSYFDREQRKLRSIVFKGENDTIEIRDPRDFVGGREGPYDLFGLYLVPDQVYPLSPLCVTKAQADEINRHRKQASDDADAAKRITMVNSNVQGLIANVRDCPSGAVLGVPGFNGMAQTIDLGGASEKQLQYIAFAGQGLESLSGISDFMRGNVTGDGTATENALAGQWADMRVKFVQNQFQLTTRSLLKRFVELMDGVPSVAFPVAVTDPMTGRKMRGTFMGGPQNNRMAGPWARSLTVEIEPYSMEYVNQVMLRAQLTEAYDRIIAYVSAGTQMPALQVMAMVDDLFEAMNIPKAGDRYVNPQMLAMQIQMAAAQQAAQIMPKQQGGKAKAA